MKIKEIQTIVTENPNDFDCAVNCLLAGGYALVRRGIEQVGPDAWKLYGELVKVDVSDMEKLEGEPVTLQEAAQVLRDECKGAAGCDSRCPMHDWCQKNLPDGPCPSEWDDPE